MYGDCSNEEYDPVGVNEYSDSLKSGSTWSLDVIPQPNEAPDASAQAEGEPDWSEGAATRSSPTPYHEDNEYSIIFYDNTTIKTVVPIPGALSKGGRVTYIAIYQAHRIVGHRVSREIRERVSPWFW